VVALLNLGASVMNINIVKGTTPLFPRDVSVGGINTPTRCRRS